MESSMFIFLDNHAVQYQVLVLSCELTRGHQLASVFDAKLGSSCMTKAVAPPENKG